MKEKVNGQCNHIQVYVDDTVVFQGELELVKEFLLRECARELLCYEDSLVDDGSHANDEPTFHQQIDYWMQRIQSWDGSRPFHVCGFTVFEPFDSCVHPYLDDYSVQ